MLSVLGKGIDANYWVRHTREGVNFLDGSLSILKDGVKYFLEVGPHPVLSALTMMNNSLLDSPQSIVCLPSLRKKVT